MKKLLSLVTVLVIAPLGAIFMASALFSKKDAELFSGGALFDSVYAEFVGAGEGAGGGASEGTVGGGVGADAGGNAAAQGNASSEGSEGGGSD